MPIAIAVTTTTPTIAETTITGVLLFRGRGRRADGIEAVTGGGV